MRSDYSHGCAGYSLLLPELQQPDCLMLPDLVLIIFVIIISCPPDRLFIHICAGELRRVQG